MKVASTTNTQTHLDDVTIATFESGLKGSLIRPESPDYDEARAVWNGMIDKRPALIVQVDNTEDVVQAVNFARTHNLLVSVRGGGHNVAGLASNDGGLVIDLRRLNSVEVDPEARVARAGGGATLGDLDNATQVYGLATPGGVVSDTGIAGLTLGGGLGWLRNKYGLTADNLIGAEVVTAAGDVVTVSETENTDLLWGLRGGGGNFGIVTTFEYKLHPVGPEVAFALVFHRREHAREALRFYHDYMESVGDDVSSLAVLGNIPPEEAYPEDIHGEPFVAFLAMYAGDAEQGMKVLQPLRAFTPNPLVDYSGPMPFVEVQTVYDEDYPAGELRYFWKSLYINDMTDDAIEEMIASVEDMPSPISTLDVWHIGGAVQRIGAEETAFGDRTANYLLGFESNWEHPEDDDVNIAWGRNWVKRMQRFSTGKEYLNFPGFQEGGEDTIKSAFGNNHARLVQLKNKYDPTNFFSQNQNIKPSV